MRDRLLRSSQTSTVIIPLLTLPRNRDTPGDRDRVFNISFSGTTAPHYYKELTDVFLKLAGKEMKDFLRQDWSEQGANESHIEKMLKWIADESRGLTIPQFLEKIRPELPDEIDPEVKALLVPFKEDLVDDLD